MYDLIGDIHGHAGALKELLAKLGYRLLNNVYQHPQRKVIFAGDYIDRGPAIRETLQIVRSMTEQGHAMAIMGNHEYNAIAYAYQLDDGSYLRSHNPAHTRQHQATLDQFSAHEEEWKEWIRWFYTLPLLLDLVDIRVVHACWDGDHIEWLKKEHNGRLSEALLLASNKKGSYAWQVVEETLKGKEFNIPEAYAWQDKDGHTRLANRTKWWLQADAATYGDVLFNCPGPLSRQLIPANLKMAVYPCSAPPVFFGHYWLEDAFPIIQADNVICLDYSIAKGGSLVAYRWSGEKKVDSANFVWVKAGGEKVEFA